MNALWIAIAMYSKIPVPQADWNDKNMQYALGCFPIIGLFIAIAEVVVYDILTVLHMNEIVFAVILTVIPLAITGGIHLDGYLDTIDARSSYGTREKKLAILKDSHVGAFAVIGCGIYLLLSVGGWSMCTERIIWMMGIVFILERVISGLSAIHIKGARTEGMLASFCRPARKKHVTMMLLIIGIACIAGMFFIWFQGTIAVMIGMMTIWYHYKYMAMKEFGGITGDLAGWFLQRCELGNLWILVLLECVC